MNITSEKLEQALKGRWRSVATQGGGLNRASSNLGYVLSGLWVYNEKSRWIEIGAKEVHENEFQLSICEPKEPPVPEPCRLNSPPREVVEKYPSDCALLDTGEHGIIEVTAIRPQLCEKAILCDSPLIMAGSNGKKILISVSNALLGAIEVRMQ